MNTPFLKTNQTNLKPQLVLLVYWFISNRHNSKIFEALNTLKNKTQGIPFSIVCLNPFNSEEDIAQYKETMNLHFEMEHDNKRTAMFYHINTFPSFLVMEKTGKILHRENGLSDECFFNLENIINKNAHPESNKANLGKVIPFENYKNNLSLLFKKI